MAHKDKTKEELLEEIKILQKRILATDIENRKISKVIQEAREYAESIVETLREPLVVLDSNLKVISANGSFYQTFRVDPKKTVGQFIFDLGNRQWDIPKLRKLLENILPKSNVFNDYRIDHVFEAIGPRTMLLNARRLDNVQMILLVFEDITGHRRTEDKYKKQVVLLESIINSIPDFIFIKDAGLRTVLCNNAYAAAVGKKPEELIGHTDIENGWDPELVYGNPAKDIRGFENDDKDVLGGKAVHNPYDPANTPNGIRIYDTYKLPLLDENKEIIGVLGISRDITERLNLEEKQKQLADIVESTTDFVGFADAKDKHVIYVNKAGRQMCGVGQDEDVTKLKIYNFHPEWVNKMFDEEILPVSVRDGVWRGESAFLNIKDKREIPVLMVLSAHKAPNGEVKTFSTISRDITERKRLEEEEKKHLKELEIFCKAGIGREERILELKQEIEKLKKELGR